MIAMSGRGVVMAGNLVTQRAAYPPCAIRAVEGTKRTTYRCGWGAPPGEQRQEAAAEVAGLDDEPDEPEEPAEPDEPDGDVDEGDDAAADDVDEASPEPEPEPEPAAPAPVGTLDEEPDRESVR